jgi:hypothetical protein
MKLHKLFFAFVVTIAAMSYSFAQDNVILLKDSTSHTRLSWDNYSKMFLEFTANNNAHRHIGFGTVVAFVPSRFGGYASYNFNFPLSHYSLGTVCRPFKIEKLDLQVFAGPALMKDNYQKLFLGPEIGFRLSPNAIGNGGWFGWWSLSASYTYLQKKSFYMVGASVSISALLAIWMAIDVYNY